MEETLEKKRPKLLLADDSVTIRKVVELTFAEEGVDVFAVGDGEAAMQKFIEVQPDIVLIDVNMPDPDGYQLCEMIKQDESTKAIPVLLLVGSFEPFDSAEAERVGADGFLTKPFQSVRDLVGKVNELLGAENGFVPPADTSDIEDLYTDSVSETYRAPDGPTDTFLGDAGMDDDLIEASYQRGAPEPEPVAAASDTVPDDTVEGYAWMAERAIEAVESVPANGGHEHSSTVLDDIDYAAPVSVEEPESRVDLGSETSTQFERVVDDFEDTLEVEEPEVEVHTDTRVDALPENLSYEPQTVEAPATPAIEYNEPAIDRHAEDATDYEPSEEFINIVARRVIEKLSDKAVRDIAREAVPRITEKLIREALDQDQKQ
jgi:CheY-like chemotaxis protein